MERLDVSILGSGMTPAPHMLFLVNEDWYFQLHYMGRARAARDGGFEVLLAMCVQEHSCEIRQQGFRVFPINLLRRSVNPMRVFQIVAELVRLYYAEKLDLVYHITSKPIFFLYGSIAARLAGSLFVVNARWV